MKEANNTAVQRLKEIDLVRPLLIILIVVYHSFIIYAGGWTQPEGYVDISLYKWIGIFSYSFVLEAFVFISGLIWGYQIKQRGLISFKEIIIKKFKRLIIPAWFWSIIYYFFIAETKGSVFEIVSGVGHLWFLVMLFWCFVGGWLFLKLRINCWLGIVVLSIAVFLSYNPLPLQIPRAMYYMLPFWCGILLGKCKMSRNIRFLSDIQSFMLLMGGGILVYVSAKYIRMPDYDSIIGKVLTYGASNIIRMFIAGLGVIALYSIARNHSDIVNPNRFYMMIGTYGMGVYVFQQFILKLLYYYTPVAGWIGPYWLPWLGIIVALLFSYGLSVLFMKTSVGRVLLGA